VIARIWRGETRAADADAYLGVLRATGLPDYLATPGNCGVSVLTRQRGDKTEFTLLTLWESAEAICGFAGEQMERARYYPEDDRYLLYKTPTVEHWDCPITLSR
jgi:hypothetical protein